MVAGWLQKEYLAVIHGVEVDMILYQKKEIKISRLTALKLNKNK